MKILKLLFLGLALLTILLFGGIFLAVNLIDPNDYKDKIQSLAMDKTGRALSIEGDIGLSYFPWAGLSLGSISMANTEEFGNTAFVEIESAQVKVKLLPLLQKSVTVDTIKLAGLKLDLQRAADGRTNWDDLLAESQSESTSSTESQPDTQENTNSDLQDLTVGSIVINDAQINWSDKQNNSDARLTGFNLTSDTIELAKPFALKTDFTLNSESVGVQAQVSGEGEISLDLDNQQYQIRQLQLVTQATGEAVPIEDFSIDLTGNLAADLLAQTATLSSLSVNSTGVALTGDINITDLSNNPTIRGALKSNTFNPREVADKLDIELPESHDQEVLKLASVAMTLTGSASAASLNDLSIKLDDTTINGSATLPDLTRAIPPVTFELALDEIDLDRYLATPDEASSAAASPAEDATTTEAAGDTPIDLPVDLLRQIDIDGIFNVGSLKISNLVAQNIQIPINASNGNISNNIEASLYQGQLTSKVAIDVTGAVPTYQFSTSIDKVQAEPLLQDLLQDTAPLTGEAIISTNITTTGSTTNQLIENLNGQYTSDFTDGAINGINIGYQLRRAKSFFSNATESSAEPISKTDFSALHVSATINNGVIQSDDLDIRAPALRINGAGSIDLPQEFIDYTINPNVVGSVQGQGGEDLDDLKGVALSIPLRGTFDELSTDLTGTVFAAMKSDFSNRAEDAAKALAKIESDKLKARAQEKADAAKLEAREKLEAEKTRVEQKAQEAIAEQKERAQQAADKLKSEAADKLKSLFK